MAFPTIRGATIPHYGGIGVINRSARAAIRIGPQCPCRLDTGVTSYSVHLDDPGTGNVVISRKAGFFQENIEYHFGVLAIFQFLKYSTVANPAWNGSMVADNVVGLNKCGCVYSGASLDLMLQSIIRCPKNANGSCPYLSITNHFYLFSDPIPSPVTTQMFGATAHDTLHFYVGVVQNWIGMNNADNPSCGNYIDPVFAVYSRAKTDTIYGLYSRITPDSDKYVPGNLGDSPPCPPIVDFTHYPDTLTVS